MTRKTNYISDMMPYSSSLFLRLYAKNIADNNDNFEEENSSDKNMNPYDPKNREEKKSKKSSRKEVSSDDDDASEEEDENSGKGHVEGS